MKIERIVTVCFSPTGNTDAAVRGIARRLADNLHVPVEHEGFTKPQDRERELTFSGTDLVIVGSPTYAGRVPNKIMPDFQNRLHGSGTAAIAVVTYGNRSFDNSLRELRNILEENGFSVFAACALVAHHAFAQIGEMRPDDQDERQVDDFCSRVLASMQKEGWAPEHVVIEDDAEVGPYYVPKGMDGKPAVFLKAKPKTDPEKCEKCHICSEGCPMGSIPADDPLVCSGVCIKCNACVTYCPHGAKYFDDEAYLSHKQFLETHYTERNDPAFFGP